MTQPPRLARALIEAVVVEPAREALLGDLEEQFRARAGVSQARAQRWYWRQAVTAAWHLRRRQSRHVNAPRRTGDPVMFQSAADLRHAVRLLVRQPLYTAVAALSLALAVGANGLVFGLVDNLVLNPFQLPDASRLVSIGSTFPRLSADEGFIEQHSPVEIDDVRHAASLRHVAAFDLGNRAVSNGTNAERVFTVLALDDPIPALGVPPVHGRGFSAEELAPNGPQVAIISHRLWSTLFGQDPGIIGRSVQVNGQPRTVVGVTAPGATLIGADLWIPWGGTSAGVPRNRRQFTVIARLSPGATLDEANAELAAIASRTAGQYSSQFPEYQGWRLRAATWTEALTGQARGPANLLLGAGLLVLFIACANLTSLVLTRLSARRREIAVRYALGAGGRHVARLLLFESLAVATVATGLGLLFARATLPAITALLPVQLANLGEPEIDLRVAAYAALIGLVAAVVTTAVPLWQARRTAPQSALKEGVTSSGGRQRLRQTLVVAELALAVVLLVGAGLLLRSYGRIQSVDPGFRTDHLLTMRLTVAWERYGDRGAAEGFFRTFIDRLNALPEVEVAAAASQFPPVLAFSMQFAVEGAPPPADTLPSAAMTVISPGYFDALGVPLVSGRFLDDRDRGEGSPSVVVNEAFMERFLGGEPRGRLLVGPGRETADVVGVVANTRNNTLLRPPQPEVFVTFEQVGGSNQFFLLARTTVDPMTAMPAVRRALAELDPDQPLYLVQTMEDALSGSVSSQRIGLTLIGAFAAVALVIACVGVYGVVSYWVATRTREIGIRMALGASSGQVTGLVARETTRLVAIGAVLGMGGGVVLARLAQSQLFETSAADPVALSGVAVVLVLVGLAAGYLPSRRAAGVDPVRVLRTE